MKPFLTTILSRMKSSVLTVIMILLLLKVNAQTGNVNFKIGAEYKRGVKAMDLAFVGDLENGIVNISLLPDKLIVTRFDPQSLDQVSEEKIPLVAATKNYNSELIADMGNGNYFWLHSDWDPDSQQEYLFYDKIDVKGGKLSTINQPMIATRKIAGSFSIWDADNTGRIKSTDKYKFTTNEKRSKLLVSYRYIPESRNDKVNHDKIGLSVFDPNMAKLWGKEFELPYTEAVMDNLAYAVDNDGNAYMLARVRSGDKKEDPITKTTGTRIELLRFTAASPKIEIVPIAMPQNEMAVVKLIQSDELGILVAGTTTKNKKKESAGGVFIGTLNKDKTRIEPYQKGFYQFPTDELKRYASKKEQRKMDDGYEFDFLYLKDLIPRENGTLFTCEVGYSKREQSPATKFYYTLHYKETMVTLFLDKQGNLSWLREIPKKQISQDEIGQIGFQVLPDKSSYHFIYCDDKKNLDLQLGEEPAWMKNHKNSVVLLNSVGKDGKQSQKVLFETKDEELKIFPTELRSIDDYHYIGKARVATKTFRPILITVND